jgi:hypothetical protein
MSDKMKTTIVAGIFTVIVAIIGGLFLVVSALIEGGFVITGPGVQVGNPQTEIVVPTSTTRPTTIRNEQENCVSNPPNGLIHFWQEGSRFWSWGIWGSENLIDFTAALGEIDTDDPDFGEFRLWLDPCSKDTIPGHGYENNARFWPLDQRGSGLASPPIMLGQEIIITLKANTGKYALGNP